MRGDRDRAEWWKVDLGMVVGGLARLCGMGGDEIRSVIGKTRGYVPETKDHDEGEEHDRVAGHDGQR